MNYSRFRSILHLPNAYSRAVFLTGIFLALSLMAVSSAAQDHTSDQTSITTKSVEKAGQDAVVAKSVIRGRAVYDDTNRPVRRARVMLLETNDKGGERTGVTNNSGEFQIKEVPAGNYIVVVDASGIITPMSFVDLESKGTEKVNFDEIRKNFDEVVVDGVRDVTVKVRARRGGAISGKVTYSDGDPAINIRVSALRKKNGTMTRIITNLNPSAFFGIQTDDRGMYRIAGLPPGEYVISASELADHNGDLNEHRGDYMGMFGGSSLVVTYYPSTTKSNNASPIQIDLGQEQREINITLADRVLRTISGTVTGQRDGAFINGARLTITSKDNVNSDALYMSPTGVSTNEQGLFTFTDMPDGVYTLNVEPPYDSGDNTVAANDQSTDEAAPPPKPKRVYTRKQQDVTVSGGDIADLRIVLTEGATLSGTVSVADGSSLPQGTFVVLTTSSGEPVPDAQRSVQEDGTFTMDAVASGVFYPSVFVSTGSKYYVKWMSVNGIDLMTNPLVVSEGVDIKNIRFEISGDAATLSGRVLSGTNVPINGATIALIPADQSKWRARSTYLFATSQSNGSYSLSGAPGEYLVIFLRGGDQPRSVNEVWIRNHASNALHVTLLPNERKNLDLTAPAR